MPATSKASRRPAIDLDRPRRRAIWALCGSFPIRNSWQSTFASREVDNTRQARASRHSFPRRQTPLDRRDQVRKLSSSKTLRRCSQVAKAADCKSAIVGSTPTSASSRLVVDWCPSPAGVVSWRECWWALLKCPLRPAILAAHAIAAAVLLARGLLSFAQLVGRRKCLSLIHI